MQRTGPVRLALLSVLTLAMLAGCAPRVAHHDLSDDQVGLGALREDNVRAVVLGPEIQQYVSRYALFGEVINGEILHDLGGYAERYNVHARERIQFTETTFSEVDPFMLRAARVTATVRVATRLMNYVGLRLKSLDSLETLDRDAKEITYTMTPEELSMAVAKLREARGTLNHDQKREIARDVVALATDMQVVAEASEAAAGLTVEGENLKALLSSTSFAAEFKGRDPERAKLLGEVLSNLNGTLAGLRAAREDGPSITRNAKVWMIYLADALQ